MSLVVTFFFDVKKVLIFGPPKLSKTLWEIKYICWHWFTLFYLAKHSSKGIICFDFVKQNTTLPIVFYELLGQQLLQ